MTEVTVEVRVVLRDGEGNHLHRFKQIIGMPFAPCSDMVLALGDGEDTYQLNLDSIDMEAFDGRVNLWYVNSTRIWIATERLTEDSDFTEAGEQMKELLAAGFREVEVNSDELFW